MRKKVQKDLEDAQETLEKFNFDWWNRDIKQIWLQCVLQETFLHRGKLFASRETFFASAETFFASRETFLASRDFFQKIQELNDKKIQKKSLDVILQLIGEFIYFLG